MDPSSAKHTVIRHGREQAPLDALQREQRDVGGNNDQQREENGRLHIQRRLFDGFESAARGACALARSC